jgi:hypothetical protein
MKNNTLKIMKLLGWQGGTIHQVIEELNNNHIPILIDDILDGSFYFQKLCTYFEYSNEFNNIIQEKHNKGQDFSYDKINLKLLDKHGIQYKEYQSSDILNSVVKYTCTKLALEEDNLL